jgi:hypothetical protein
MANHNTTRMAWRTTTDENAARDLMLIRNRSRRGRTDLTVMVDGPGDGEFTVMDLRDAIDNEFLYRWEV